MSRFSALSMNQLWFAIMVCLMLFTPSDCQAIVNTAEVSVTSEAPQIPIRRIYGENIASEVYAIPTYTGFQDLVHKFTENHSRWVMDQAMVDRGANMYARNYIVEQLKDRSSGRIEVEIIGNHKNVVGRLPGYLPGDDNPVLVVSAHYDSVKDSDGANADGSGIAVVLELAYAMSQYMWPLDIYFIAFNALYSFQFMSGSPEVANVLQQRGIDILAMYNVDTILVTDSALPSDERIQIGYLSGSVETYHQSKYWGDLARMISNNYGMNSFVPIPSGIFYLWETSDQEAFYQRGYNNILCVFESGLAIDGSYHNVNDRWDYRQLNYNLGRETAAVIGASMAFTMGRKYGEPVQLKYNFIIGGGRIEKFYMAVTTSTILNITVRWFGGSTSYNVYNPSNTLVASAICDYTSAWVPTNILNIPVTAKGLYALEIENTNFVSVGYELIITYDSDIDGNGILDSQEYWLDESLFVTDQDNDGISDAEEIFLGTDGNQVDSDGDTMDDKYEVDMGFDPNDASDGNLDADSDGLTNAQEYSGGLNPFSSDSDGDSIDDLWELENGLNPLIDDAALDPDGDGRTNLEEYLAGTNPQIAEFSSPPILFIVSPIAIVATIAGFVYFRNRKFV